MKTLFFGNIGQDAKVSEGKVSFSVATELKKDETVWINCFMKVGAESKLPEALKKGTYIFVDGNITQLSYTKEEKEVTSTTVWVNEIKLLGAAKNKEDNQ
ncbi:single-stranded DNA-binding protein [Parabacteroides sp. PF5-9]|uniref:single-stranded DNA-binding protein n=1 Tax=Parabacteroides sp. PF5-9 TaxID=1742404 RepID=UPI002476FC72|nr:single-stranded DNA-binding protein [Parabacteroides sp. PF5-9]MDH6358944.1 single-stranded DNA-binding protein [Parabacteroides sp. PF5-9]